MYMYLEKGPTGHNLRPRAHNFVLPTKNSNNAVPRILLNAVSSIIFTLGLYANLIAIDKGTVLLPGLRSDGFGVFYYAMLTLSLCSSALGLVIGASVSSWVTADIIVNIVGILMMVSHDSIKAQGISLDGFW